MRQRLPSLAPLGLLLRERRVAVFKRLAAPARLGEKQGLCTATGQKLNGRLDSISHHMLLV